MGATVREVAKLAQVSLGTVSNVLNQKTTVKPLVRARVEAAIEQLDYTSQARANSTSRKTVLAVTFLLGNRELSNPFHSRVLEGVGKQCECAGVAVLYCRLDYGPELEPGRFVLPPALRTEGMSGCVVLSGVHYPNLLEALDRHGMPYVLLANNFVSRTNRRPEDQVRFDDVDGAREGTRYLIEMGHKDIWFVGDTSLPWFNHRYQGYLDAMCEAGLKPRGLTAGISDDRFVDGFNCTATILKDKQPVTAIFAGTDEVAYGCWECLQQMSLRVPDQVSLLGFDDQRESYKGLGLSTVRVEAEAIGESLAGMAISKIKNAGKGPCPEIVIPTRLMKRGTCQPCINAST